MLDRQFEKMKELDDGLLTASLERKSVIHTYKAEVERDIKRFTQSIHEAISIGKTG